MASFALLNVLTIKPNELALTCLALFCFQSILRSIHFTNFNGLFKGMLAYD